MIRIWCVPIILLGAIVLFCPSAFSASNSADGAEVSLEGIAPDQVDSVLAKLSDEQVRSLLIVELRKEAPSSSLTSEASGGFLIFVVKWLHMIDSDTQLDQESRAQRIADHIFKVPADLAGIVRQFGDGTSMVSALKNIALVLFVLLAALVVEFLFKGVTAGFRRQFMEQGVPDLGGLMRFWAGIMRILPSLMSVLVFGAVSLLLFMLTPVSAQLPVRLLFMAVLFVILFARVVTLFSQLFCAPKLASLRLLAINDAAAENLHQVMLIFFYFAGVAFALLALVKELGIASESLILLALASGTILLLIMAFMIVRNRKAVTEYILSGESKDAESSWVVRQFALLWHVLALLYLFMVWLIFFFQQIAGTRQDKGAFLMSLLIVPLFLVLDRIGQWVVRTTVGTLKIYTTDDNNSSADDADEEKETAEYKEHHLVVRVGRVVRLAILFSLGVWVLNLWGYHIPYATAITRAVFESLVTLALALLFWRVASSYIERKIQETIPEEEDEDEQDGEWGAAAQRGRSYTLLPMVRKFLGTVLVVMVTLIILSAIGVNIGPLLAGAGVIGIAIGFGAQKLVSDILSGFFYLLDDAFRVGEYLQAGSVSGAVEAITLRNVMLRHHRGMLQIVPYSELGAITNFMRGGIVVKFNLEFPYDTNIDQVRKIIKKVGLAMLEDPEFSEDFIKPVKSQGVREITSSVMVIRVKFTAKPGTHFVIRREAYRRITEALAAKGLHYAHRKVIVELPQEIEGGKPLTVEQKQKIAEAGAAAKTAMDAEEAKKTEPGGGTPPAGMPGM